MTEQSTTSPEVKKYKKPIAFVLAGVLAAGLLGTALMPNSPMAIAQTTAVTPYANAPFSFADLAEKVRPAVVSIRVKNKGGRKRSGQKFDFKGPDLPDGHPLKEFFKRFGEEGPRGQGPRRRRTSQGSGFIISDDGYVVTNHHVISGGSSISVILENGDKHDAEIIGSDERTDLALLKIKAKKKLHFVKFADKTARVGDWVLAVGNPFGLGGTVTAGIVSAHKRNIGSGPYDFLQIDAAVNRGNSGGPAFGLDGAVIGVNTAIFSPSGGNVGIAFAVPSVLAKRVIDQLKSNGKVARGWLGVTIQSVDEDIAASLGLDKPKGAMVTSFTKNSPASKSDMEVGDLIVAVDGSPIDDSRDLARKIAGYAPSNKVKVTVLRDSKEQDITIKLGSFPNTKQLASLKKHDMKPSSEEMEDLGLSLAPASEFTSGSVEEGVVIVEVNPDSDAAERGLKAGDIILEVAGDVVSDPADVQKSVRKARDKGRRSVHMLVRSGDRQRFIALPLKKI